MANRIAVFRWLAHLGLCRSGVAHSRGFVRSCSHSTLADKFKISLKVAPRSLITILGACVILAGCSAQISSTVATSANLQAFKTFYVVRNDADSREVYKVIQEELVKLGRDVRSGPRSSIPKDVDVIITYQDYWVWDLAWYLPNLLIQLRNPKTNVLLASGLSSRPSVVRKEPEFMAREVLESILK